jgi:glycine cleavage system aminomethyltransferase T
VSVMVSMLRRHGATIIERHGRPVAAHFGSAAAEAAVCRGGAGLADRSDRATLELRGPSADVDQALAELGVLGGHAWSTRLSPTRALVRCEGEDQALCTSAMLRAEDASVRDVSDDHAAVDLVGPRAEEVLQAAGLTEEDAVTVLRDGDGGVELLVARGQGPALWNRLLETGEPFGLACVGLDALEHLAVSGHVSRGRHA